jgi:primosomal protein N' (replication factor Y)
MLARVIPVTKLPRHLQYFDYLVPENILADLKPGTMVNIPWKNFFIKGVVKELVTKSDFEHLKEIKNIDNRITFLPHQLELADWFARYYYYSLAGVLKMMLPDLPKKAGSSKKENLFVSYKKITTTKDFTATMKQVFAGKSTGYLLFPHNYDYKIKFYLDLCEEISKTNEQILILFPQTYKVRDFYQYLPESLRRVTEILSNDYHASKNRYFEAWQRVASGQKRIVLGTRSAVFAPILSSSLIIVDDAHSEDYKQWDQTPRYEVVNVAQQIQELTECRLILSSLAPRIEDSFSAKEKKYKLISLGEQFHSVKVINLNEERKKQKRFTYLSDELLAEMEETLAQDKRTILIVNKKGLYSYFFCEDCGYEAICPQCNLPLILEKNNELVCHHCHHAETVPLVCPKCSSVKLKKLGMGVSQVEKTLREMFGDVVVEYDGEKVQTFSERSIIISSNLNLPETVWQNLGLFAFCYIDSLVYLADFNSNYKLYSLITENFPRVNAQSEAKVLVQTCFPENMAFKCLNENYLAFYKQELAGREMFHYPPFSRAVKVFFQHHDLGVCEREAKDLYEKLRGRFEVSEPYLYYHQKVRQRYRYQMVILILKQLSLEKENALLKEIPEFWTIDKNPVNLL